jgi:hypothetical protein
MIELTLAAEDTEDLEIISARLQDAVARVKDLVWLPKSRRFACIFNRFKWETNRNLRVRSRLYFDSVRAVQSQGLRRDAPDAVMALLAIRFTPNGPEDPTGTIELLFAGGAAIRLDVECVEAGLTDVSGEWAARGRPDHDEA